MNEEQEKSILELFQATQIDNEKFAIKGDKDFFTKQFKKGIENNELKLTNQQAALTMLSRIPKALRYFPNICYLNLYGNIIRDEGLSRVKGICSNSPNIIKLDVGSNDLSDASALILAEIIKETNIKSLQIGRKGPSYTQNWFTRDGLVTIIKAVRKTNKLRCFGIAGIAGMKQKKTQRYRDFPIYISNLFEKCTNLVTLDLTDSGFHTSDQFELAKGIRENKNLKHLTLNGNNFAPGETLVQAICNIPALVSLNLRNCGLNEAACDILSTKISGHCTIVNLDISSNPIKAKGIRFLLAALATNDSITTLNISDTGADSSIAAKLEALIIENPLIDDLNLSKNNIGEVIGEIFGRTLGTQNVLRKLNISSTRLTDSGGIAIAQALVQNKTLRRLNMSDNFFTKAVGYDLLEIFQQNETLHHIDISANQIDVWVLSGFTTLCNRNRNAPHEKKIDELRKQYIHLSIENSKIPAHNEKLDILKSNKEKIDEEVENVQEQIDKFNVESQVKIQDLEKSILEIEKMKDLQKESIAKTEASTEEARKAKEASRTRFLSEIALNSEKYKSYEEQAAKADKDREEYVAKSEIEKAALQKEIEEAEELLRQAQEILADKENLIDADIPEYPYDDERKADYFQAVADSQQVSPSKGSSTVRSRRSARQTSRKSSRKSKASDKSPKSAKIVKPKKTKK